MLVAAPRRGTADSRRATQHLDELARLADTAGATVAARLTQQVERPSPRSYLGAGKLAELKELARDKEASLVIFDEELSPVQGKVLEESLGLRVMDRTELILDIFARRAWTREAKLQVELAQLEYLLPRLQRMWVHLSRIRGGIGLRGPGETQLETDRRMIRTRISRLRRRLEKVRRHRDTIRRGRRPVPTAALVGYTNAGKTSLLRALTGADAFVEDRLFATLDTLTREADVAPGCRMRFIDTVGFIRKLPHNLVASFRATLEEVTLADVVIHVIDASRPDWEEQVGIVDGVLDDLGVDDACLVHVFNKMDIVLEPDALLDGARNRFGQVALVSAALGDVHDLTALLAREWVSQAPAG
ncbi:MAG: GTPase HflX [Gemmatimonadales bacterium]